MVGLSEVGFVRARDVRCIVRGNFTPRMKYREMGESIEPRERDRLLQHWTSRPI